MTLNPLAREIHVKRKFDERILYICIYVTMATGISGICNNVPAAKTISNESAEMPNKSANIFPLIVTANPNCKRLTFMTVFRVFQIVIDLSHFLSFSLQPSQEVRTHLAYMALYIQCGGGKFEDASCMQQSHGLL